MVLGGDLGCWCCYTIVLTDTYGDGWSWGGVPGVRYGSPVMAVPLAITHPSPWRAGNSASRYLLHRGPCTCWFLRWLFSFPRRCLVDAAAKKSFALHLDPNSPSNSIAGRSQLGRPIFLVQVSGWFGYRSQESRFLQDRKVLFVSLPSPSRCVVHRLLDLLAAYCGSHCCLIRGIEGNSHRNLN